MSEHNNQIMRFIISVVFFLSFCTFAMGQATKYSDTTYHISVNKDSSIPSTAQFEASKGVIIQNSFPKGGLRYTDPTGKDFVYVIFWTRVINETASPIELTVNFPADSFAFFPQPDSYLKLFLPPGKMTLDKESLFDYGVTDLKSFLDTGLNKPTMLKRTINPKEECFFYIGMLFHVPDNGPVRTELVLKEQDLFYRISIAKQIDSVLIPCGQIVIKN